MSKKGMRAWWAYCRAAPWIDTESGLKREKEEQWEALHPTLREIWAAVELELTSQEAPDSPESSEEDQK